jgi:hypothetical protein
MMKIMVNAVGFGYRGKTPDVLNNKISSQLKLIPEPTNSHDPHAVKIMCEGDHVAYIQKEKSKQICTLLRQANSYTIYLKNLTNSSAALEIEFQLDLPISQDIITPNAPEKPGVYEIRFNLGRDVWSYFGQSVNVKKRYLQHINDLKKGNHHNRLLQEAWMQDPKSINFIVVRTVEAYQTPFDRQVQLCKLEVDSIRSSIHNCANMIDGDLVLSTDAQKDLDLIKDEAHRGIRKLIEQYEEIRDSIGEILLSQNIVWCNDPTSKLSKSNVLSQIKKRRSYLEAPVNVNADHPLFKPMKNALQDNQDKIERIKNKKSVIRSFPQRPWNANKYSVVQQDEITRFLDAVEQCLKYKPLQVLSAGSRVTPKIKYKPVLETVLSPNVLNILKKGIGTKEQPQPINPKNSKSIVQRLKTYWSE